MELETADENGFRSLQDALEHYGVEEAAIPTWIPQRFSIDRVTVLKMNTSITINGKYISNNDDELLIRGTVALEGKFSFETNPTPVNEGTLYTANGISFVLSANMDEVRAVWTVNSYTYSVSGNITEAELKQMLGSIQIKE